MQQQPVDKTATSVEVPGRNPGVVTDELSGPDNLVMPGTKRGPHS